MTSSPAKHVTGTRDDESTPAPDSQETDSGTDTADPPADHVPTAVPPNAPKTVADGLLNAQFVKLLVYPSGDCIAATAMLRTALSALETPYHITTVRTPEEAAQAASSTETTTTVLSIGVDLPRTDRLEPVQTHELNEAADDGEDIGNGTGVDPPDDTEDGTGSGSDDGGESPSNFDAECDDDADAPVNLTESDDAVEDTLDDTGADESEGERTADERAPVSGVENGSDPSEGEDPGLSHAGHEDDESGMNRAEFPLLDSLPVDASAQRDKDEARREALATTKSNGDDGGDDAEADEDKFRSASQADSHRDLHPAKRGVKMATERIGRTAVGNDPLPPEDDEDADVEDSMWPFDGFSWYHAFCHAASGRYHHSEKVLPKGTDGETITSPIEDTPDRSVSAQEAAAIAGCKSGDERREDDESDDEDVPVNEAKLPESDDTDDDDEIGAAQFIADGGQVASPSVSAGSLLHIGTQLHKGDRTQNIEGETVGNVSVGVSASVHAASTVASLADRNDDVDAVDPVCALAGTVTYSGGRNAAFDLGDDSTWPSRYGASTFCKRARSAGITSQIGLGTPLTSTPSALQHTTFAHAEFSGSAGGLAQLMQSCPVIDVFPDTDAEDNWEKFADSVRRTSEPNWVGSDTDREALGPPSPNSTPRFTRSGPALLGLILGCHRLPEKYSLPTVEGYADVLNTLARNGHTAKALSVASQIGDETDEDDTGVKGTVDLWKSLVPELHDRVREGEKMAHYDGTDGTVAYKLSGTESDEEDEGEPPSVGLDHIAILLDQFRSEGCPTLVVSENEAAAVGSCTDAEDDGGRLTAREALAEAFDRHPERIGCDGNVAFLTTDEDDGDLIARIGPSDGE